MKRSSAICWTVLLATLASSGCITPWNTSLPKLGWDDPRTAKKRQERFDAYPMPDLGPETYTRQRDMAIPRDEPRRLSDDLLNTKFGVPNSTTQSEREYNQIVKKPVVE